MLFLKMAWTSLIVQWLRICLPTLGRGFNPLSGKIPRAAGQLSPCAAATEPVSSGACATQ